MTTTQKPETSWPDQASYPGQTHVAPGPHSMTNMYRAHHAFRRDLAGTAARPLVDRLGLEHLSQPGDVGVQRAVGGPRRLPGPHQVGHLVGRHRLAGHQGESGQHRAGLARPEVQPDGLALAVSPGCPGAPQHADLHAHTVTAPGRR